MQFEDGKMWSWSNYQMPACSLSPSICSIDQCGCGLLQLYENQTCRKMRLPRGSRFGAKRMRKEKRSIFFCCRRSKSDKTNWRICQATAAAAAAEFQLTLLHVPRKFRCIQENCVFLKPKVKLAHFEKWHSPSQYRKPLDSNTRDGKKRVTA